MKENAFVKIPRSLLNSEYFNNPNLFRFIVGLIGMARFVPEENKGVYVDIGQVLTSKKFLMEKFNIPKTSLNRMLEKLISDNVISIEKAGRYDFLIKVNIAPQTAAPSSILKNIYKNPQDC